MIKARSLLNAERDVFIVTIGGWDSHNTLTDTEFLPLQKLNAGLTSFAQEMKAEGVWGNVVVPVTSEFGRTITSNGAGTDHAWAGNMMVFGGQLNGSRILGTFPQGIASEADARISRGRLIPSTPWESLWQPIAQWFGVPESQMDFVLPLRKNFGTCTCPDDAPASCTAELATAAEDAGAKAKPPVLRKDACEMAGYAWVDHVLHEADLFNPVSEKPNAPPPPRAPPPKPPSPPAESDSGGETISDPATCPLTMTCVVLYMGASGDSCSPVPIWDLSGCVHDSLPTRCPTDPWSTLPLHTFPQRLTHSFLSLPRHLILVVAGGRTRVAILSRQVCCGERCATTGSRTALHTRAWAPTQKLAQRFRTGERKSASMWTRAAVALGDRVYHDRGPASGSLVGDDPGSVQTDPGSTQ